MRRPYLVGSVRELRVCALTWQITAACVLPYLSTRLPSSSLFGLGDCIAQTGIEGVDKRKGYDFTRTARLVVWGGAIFAPLVTRELRLLSRIEFASKPATIAARVAADQLLFTPTVCVFDYAWAR